ncbi:MAG: hypothetical protein NPMRTHETA2_1260011 [Nitrosopumilales archaeon]|nr:MAG: hypothetical protein NPMRTHETA2_1260011 [Nitrosopumilales archaeon]
MTTKNTTIRLDKEMIEEIDQSCRDEECTRNDWMKDAASEKLQREKAQDQEVIEDIKSEPKPSVEDNPEVKEPKQIVELIPKEIIKEVPQDNSNKPPVHFKAFGDALLPFAKRYDK